MAACVEALRAVAVRAGAARAGVARTGMEFGEGGGEGGGLVDIGQPRLQEGPRATQPSAV